MAFETESGTFTLNTVTGNQTVTLANGSLTPKAVIVWTTRQTADGFATDSILFMGFGTSSTARATIGCTSQDAQASSVAHRLGYNGGLLRTRAVAGGVILEDVDLVSFGAGQFVVNVLTAGSAIKVHYLVLGGSDLTNAVVVEVATTTAETVTGLAFQPDFVMFLGGEHSNVQIDGDPISSNAQSFGFATASSQGCVGWGSQGGLVTMNTERVQLTDHCWAVPNTAAGYRFKWAFTGFTADGWTVTKTNNVNSRFMWALALKGGQYEVGADTQKTSTAGTKATTTAFQPTGLLLGSFCEAAAATVQSHARISLGAASAATSRAASWIGDTDAAADSECDRAMQQDQCLTLVDAGSPAAFAAAADLSSFNATDFTLDWDDGAGGNPDATARQFIYAAFGSAGGGQTIAVGLATETDSALGATAEKTATLGMASETDSALPATTKKTLALGLASETDTALPLQGSQTVVLGIAIDTETALGLTVHKTKAAGQPAESDTVLPLTSRKAVQLGIAIETDSGLGATAAKTGTLGLASETETALTLAGIGKQLLVGLALEADSALALVIDVGATGPMYSVTGGAIYEHKGQARQVYEHGSQAWQVYEHRSQARQLVEG